METTEQLFSKEVSIKSPAFTVDDIGYYQLFLSLTSDYFRVSVVSSTDNSCLFLEGYRFLETLKGDDLLAALHQIYDHHPFLKANYWQNIRVIISTGLFTLVPKEIFEPKEKSQYLHLVGEIQAQETVLFSDFTFADAVTVLAADQRLKDWFIKLYDNKTLHFYHQTTPVLEGNWQIYGDDHKKRLQVHIEPNRSIITYLDEEDKSIVFCNQFAYKTAKDLLYYVAFVLEELELKPQELTLQLTGVIYEESEIFATLKRFLPDLSIINEVEWLYFSHHFGDTHLSSFFDVFSLAKCSSSA